MNYVKLQHPFALFFIENLTVVPASDMIWAAIEC